MVKVAFITATGRAIGGAEQSLLLLLSRLPPSIMPIIVSFEEGPFTQILRERGFDVHIHPVERNLLRVRRDQNVLPFAIRSAFACIRLARFLRDLGPDVVHTNNVKSGLFGTISARLAGVPVVMHVRDLLEGPSRAIYGLLGRFCANECVPVSQLVARWYGFSPSKVVYNAIDLDDYCNLPTRVDARAALGLSPDISVIGMVGRINRWKGHERFLRVVSALSARTNVVGAIVGEARFRDEDFESELVLTAERLHIRDRIIFVPWSENLPPIYVALDVLCNFSTREPFGRSMLEAAACGTPSVCFDDGGGTEIFQDPRYTGVVGAGDEVACAAAIEGLLLNDRAFREARTIALSSADRFPISAQVDALSSIFFRLARRK